MMTKLKAIRRASGMTQNELAESVNATKRQIGAWERGENDLPLDFASAIADVLGCTLDEIAGREIEHEYQLDLNESELVDIMRNITNEGQKQLLIYARGIASSYPKTNTLRGHKAS